jgi:hypothetical protein
MTFVVTDMRVDARTRYHVLIGDQWVPLVESGLNFYGPLDSRNVTANVDGVVWHDVRFTRRYDATSKTT